MGLALLATIVAVGLQLLRVLFPLAFDLSEEAGSIDAGLFTLTVLALGPFLAVVARPLGRTPSRWVLIGGMVLARVAMQLVHPITLWLAAIGVVLFLSAFTLQVHELRSRDEGAPVLVLGLVLGMALDTALRTATWTWDLAWQHGAAPLVLTLALGAAVLALLATERVPAADADSVRIGTLFMLGPFLMLQTLFLQSPAFVASAAGAPLPAAASVILVADAIAVAKIRWLVRVQLGRAVVAVAGLALVADALLLRAVEGPVIALVVLIGTPLAAGLLLVGLARAGGRGRGPVRTALAISGADVTFLLLAFAYQVHYDIPLPVSNAWLPPLAALLLAAPVVARKPGRARGPAFGWRLALAPLLLLLVPLAMTLTRDAGSNRGGRDGIRVLDYNLHMAVSGNGQVDPETLARTIEEQDPDVVILQEVARGWVTNGTMDLAEWMSARLGMPYTYGPAADGQFGNAVLTSLTVSSAETGLLGRFEGNMDRGWVRVELSLGPAGHEGETRLVVIGTHLQHREQDAQTRLAQIEVLLRDAWRSEGTTVIAGDMNAFPGSEEVARFTSAGFVSAQDEAGMGDLPTSWRDGTRIDYVFATPDVGWSDFARPYSEASDHLPLAVTIHVR